MYICIKYYNYINVYLMMNAVFPNEYIPSKLLDQLYIIRYRSFTYILPDSHIA